MGGWVWVGELLPTLRTNVPRGTYSPNSRNVPRGTLPMGNLFGTPSTHVLGWKYDNDTAQLQRHSN